MSVHGATLAGRWRRAATSVPEKTFLVWEGSDGAVASWTYAEFDALVEQVASRLLAIGVRSGSAVHLALANSPAFVATWLATAALGAFSVPSDPRSAPREFATHIRMTGPVCAVVGRQSRVAYNQANAPAGGPQVLHVDEDDVEMLDLRRSPDGCDRVPVPPAAVAAVMFTSGTTSAPKGVIVTQANYAYTGDVMGAAAAVSRDDRLLVVLPLFHANAQYYSFMPAICAGASVALMHTFSASGFLAQARRHQATHASLFAAPMRMILARTPDSPAPAGLRHCWYAQNVTAEQHAQLGRLLGCPPRQLYGMTETIPAVLTNDPLSPRHDAMGSVTLGCEVEINDESGSPAGEGEVGEVVVRGRRGVTLFDGYLDDPDATAACFRNGIFCTGDRAHRDGDGLFYFAGRGGDILKVAGENVSIVEIEAVLAEHPHVFEAAVVGVPDEVRDEVPVAFVVRAAGHPELGADALAAWCSERLSPAKRPRSVRFVDELPRTSVGKIRKFILREQAAPEAVAGTTR